MRAPPVPLFLYSCVLISGGPAACGDAGAPDATTPLAAPAKRMLTAPDWACWKSPPMPSSWEAADLATPPKTQLAASYAKWVNLKATHGADYSYVAYTPCGECSASSETQVLLTAGAATSRSYFAWTWDPADPATEIPTSAWTETGGDVGSHQSGARPLDMEALYDLCNQMVLTQPPGRYVFGMALDLQGILRRCTYRDPTLPDDPGTGVTLCSFGFAH